MYIQADALPVYSAYSAYSVYGIYIVPINPAKESFHNIIWHLLATSGFGRPSKLAVSHGLSLCRAGVSHLGEDR